MWKTLGNDGLEIERESKSSRINPATHANLRADLEGKAGVKLKFKWKNQINRNLSVKWTRVWNQFSNL